jgi:hypothetical protein
VPLVDVTVLDAPRRGAVRTGLHRGRQLLELVLEVSPVLTGVPLVLDGVIAYLRWCGSRS